MTRAVLALAFWLLLLAVPAHAQITIPYPNFVSGTIADPEQVDANNAALSSQALNRTGGTMTGTLTTLAILPNVHDTYDIGTTGTRFQDLFLSGIINVSGSVTVDTTTLFVDATNNRVGIGTTTPTVGLQVSAGAPSIDLTSTGGGISWRHTSSAAGTYSIGDAADANPAMSVTSAGVWTWLGDSSFNAGGANASAMRLDLTNSTSGTGAFTEIRALSSTGVNGYLRTLSNGFTTSGPNIANGSVLGASGAAGLSIVTENAAGDIRFYAGSSTLRWTMEETGHLVGSGSVQLQPPNGSASVPSHSFSGDTDTGLYFASASPRMAVDGVEAMRWSSISAEIPTRDTGSTSNAPAVIIGRNSNADTCGGTLVLTDIGDTRQYIWVDDADQLRITTTVFGNCTNDVGGTVVGTQTSFRASKDILGPFTDDAAALTTILQTPLWNFRYKNGAYNGQEYVGITTDDSPIFGQDHGRSFNPVTAFGYTVAAIKALQAEIDALRADLAAQKGRF